MTAPTFVSGELQRCVEDGRRELRGLVAEVMDAYTGALDRLAERHPLDAQALHAQAGRCFALLDSHASAGEWG